jgi:xylulokinase
VTVGIDIGTTSVKAVAVDSTGAIVERVRIPHPVRVPAPDRFEHDAARAWRRGPLRAFRALSGTEPAAVAMSTMVPSLTAVDRRGRPVTPGLLYGDGRGRPPNIERRSDSDEGEVLGFLQWTSAACPDAFGYWPAPAVANYALGKRGAVDFGTAYTSAPLFGGQEWDAALSETYGARVAQLPEIVMTGEEIGRVTGTDVMLAAGCVDGMCEQIAAGAETPGDVLVICGTTLIAWIVTPTPVTAPGLWSIPQGSNWLGGGPSNAGGLFVGWASRLLGRAGLGGELVPDSVPVWLPYVRGERSPLHDPSRRASLHDLNLTHGPAAVQRAAWEASGFVVRHFIDLAGIPAHRIVATGGGTKVDGWMQALADSTGLPVHVSAEPEGAAMGAAWLARMALGWEQGFDGAQAWARTGRIVDPDPVWADAAVTRYGRFRELT